jgi:DNA-binding transcriptional regulator YdaS (Cro superfamily)
MSNFLDFVSWATTQRRAAELLGLSESMLSLIATGKRSLQPDHAIRAEQVSGGFFRADDLLPDTEFARNEKGEVIGWHVKAKNNDS